MEALTFGAYRFIIETKESIWIKTALHKSVILGKGLYLYIGRASRYLPQRITRHQNKKNSTRAY